MQRLEIYQSLWAMELRRPDGFEWPLEKKFEMCRAAGYDGLAIDLVDTKTGVSKQLLLGRSRMGQWLSFSPDGTTLTACAEDGAVQLLKLAPGLGSDAPAAETPPSR